MLTQIFSSKKGGMTLISLLVVAVLSIVALIVRPDLAEWVFTTAVGAVTGLGGIYSIAQGGVDKAVALSGTGKG
jgi:hypothetical protein